MKILSKTFTVKLFLMCDVGVYKYAWYDMQGDL